MSIKTLCYSWCVRVCPCRCSVVIQQFVINLWILNDTPSVTGDNNNHPPPKPPTPSSRKTSNAAASKNKAGAKFTWQRDWLWHLSVSLSAISAFIESSDEQYNSHTWHFINNTTLLKAFRNWAFTITSIIFLRDRFAVTMTLANWIWTNQFSNKNLIVEVFATEKYEFYM